MITLVFKFDQTYIGSKVLASINDSAAGDNEDVAGETVCMARSMKNIDSKKGVNKLYKIKNPAYGRAGKLEVSEFGFPLSF